MLPSYGGNPLIKSMPSPFPAGEAVLRTVEAKSPRGGKEAASFEGVHTGRFLGFLQHLE